jgi:hypothetical protein
MNFFGLAKDVGRISQKEAIVHQFFEAFAMLPINFS